jgi:hypothetical protein
MGNIKDTADAIKGIVEAVPVYEDMLQPASKELGKGLLTLSKTVNIALSPLSGFVWGYEKIAQYLGNKMIEKLKNVPEENIITPDPTIAVPAIEALRYTAHKDELREMFSNLISTSMNKDTATLSHPSFVETIKQINSDEAKIIALMNTNDSYPVVKVKAINKENDYFSVMLSNFSLLPYIAQCASPELGPSYLENIVRLGLGELDYTTYVSTPNVYVSINDHPLIKNYEAYTKSVDKRFELQQGRFSRTSYGRKFYEACIQN